MKIRIVIEYDTDDDESTLKSERHAWMNGEVTVEDIIGAEAGTVRFEEMQSQPNGVVS